ncbi:hypothetical protein EV193_10765 [Herbihabitans rhizosphaerae]|uniref:Uncharacterized protein n=1 Tax=Herbihabitans rhizosphaerae TaxID=1872711 RepID=A0A4Q7KJM1_9PSEU|nr:hypothetical protein EV193_10765 [Herbihabitans rhizosphaerae]
MRLVAIFAVLFGVAFLHGAICADGAADRGAVSIEQVDVAAAPSPLDVPDEPVGAAGLCMTLLAVLSLLVWTQRRDGVAVSVPRVAARRWFAPPIRAAGPRLEPLCLFRI